MTPTVGILLLLVAFHSLTIIHAQEPATEPPSDPLSSSANLPSLSKTFGRPSPKLKLDSFIGLTADEIEAKLPPEVCQRLLSRHVKRFPSAACVPLLRPACFNKIPGRHTKRAAKLLCNPGAPPPSDTIAGSYDATKGSDPKEATAGGSSSLWVYLGVIAVGLTLGTVGAMMYRRSSSSA